MEVLADERQYYFVSIELSALHNKGDVRILRVVDLRSEILEQFVLAVHHYLDDGRRVDVDYGYILQVTRSVTTSYYEQFSSCQIS